MAPAPPAPPESESPPAKDGKTPAASPKPHWSLTKEADINKATALFRLPHKLTADSYVLWQTAMVKALKTIKLSEYALGQVPRPSPADEPAYSYWETADAIVQTVLIGSMSDEVATKLGHLATAADMWTEAIHLYGNLTATDWTMLITRLVTEKWTPTGLSEGDPLDHIAKMKGYRRDLQLMDRDIDDCLFACFLRISMPSDWNGIFAGLPSVFNSNEVERRIRDEWAVRSIQATTETVWSANHQDKPIWTRDGKHSKQDKSKTSDKKCTGPTCKDPKCSGEPYCTNCGRPGHWVVTCWAPGGPLHGHVQRDREQRSGHQSNLDHKNRSHHRSQHKRRDSGSSFSSSSDEDWRQKRKHGKSDKARYTEEAEDLNYSSYLTYGHVSGTDSDNESFHSGSEIGAYEEPIQVMAATSHTSSPPTVFILDSAATQHVTTDREIFRSFTSGHSEVSGIKSGGDTIKSYGSGTIQLLCSVNGVSSTVQVENVHYCPDASHNVISESVLDQRGFRLVRSDGHANVVRKSDSKNLLESKLHHGLYYIRACAIAPLLPVLPPTVRSVSSNKQVSFHI